MQKLTKTEIRSIICELENNAEDVEKLMITKSENAFDREYFKRRAEKLYSLAEKLCFALGDEDKRIEIV